MSGWWASLGRGQRAVALVVGVVVGVNLVLSAVSSMVGSDPGGPASSAFGTGDDGLEGWTDLLADDGRRVERSRTDIPELDLDPAATVVVADPVDLDTDDLRALSGFVTSGGRLILTGEQAAGLLGALTGVEVGRTTVSAGDLSVWVPSEHTGPAVELAGDRGGRWLGAGPLVPLAGDGEQPVLVVGDVDAGKVLALADTDLLHNRNLARADNASLALALVGDSDRPVIFAESVRGRPGGFSAMPAAWKWMLAGLAVALCAGLWSAGARFGPPEPPPLASRPPRRDHVEAVAAALHRSAERRGATAPSVSDDDHRTTSRPDNAGASQ